jgi:hypothetical protein
VENASPTGSAFPDRHLQGGMTVLTDERVLAQAPHADRARTRIPWRRLAAEVFVIMESILAAFVVHTSISRGTSSRLMPGLSFWSESSRA